MAIVSDYNALRGRNRVLTRYVGTNRVRIRLRRGGHTGVVLAPSASPAAMRRNQDSNPTFRTTFSRAACLISCHQVGMLVKPQDVEILFALADGRVVSGNLRRNLFFLDSQDDATKKIGLQDAVKLWRQAEAEGSFAVAPSPGRKSKTTNQDGREAPQVPINTDWDRVEDGYDGLSFIELIREAHNQPNQPRLSGNSRRSDRDRHNAEVAESIRPEPQASEPSPPTVSAENPVHPGSLKCWNRTSQGYEAKLFGLVVGCAVGDAIGSPLEGLSSTDIKDRFGDIDGFIDLREVPYYRMRPRKLLLAYRQPGTHTDDTQQLLAIVESYLKHGELTPEGVAEELASLRRVARGTGRSFRTLCDGMVKQGLSRRDAKHPDSAGCGSAMRAGAVALLPYRDYDELLERSVIQSIVSHSDLRAHLAAALIATTAGWALQLERDVLVDGDLDQLRRIHADRQERISESIPIVRAVCERHGERLIEPEHRADQFLASLDCIGGFLARADSTRDARARLPELIREIATSAKDDRPYQKPPTGVMSFALEAPITAYAVFLFFGASLPETIKQAVALGGDTDSIAAMAGQLSGALVGFHPDWWTYEDEPQESGSDGRLVAAKDAAHHSLPIEWFAGLVANMQLLYRVNLLTGRDPMEQPKGLPFSMLNWQLEPLVAFEQAISQAEKRTRLRLRTLVKFFERNLDRLVEAAQQDQPSGVSFSEGSHGATANAHPILYDRLQRYFQLQLDEPDHSFADQWLADLLADRLGLKSTTALRTLIDDFRAK